MLTSGLSGQLTAYMYMYFVYWCTSSQKRFYFFQLNPSRSQKIKVCLSLLLFLSLSVYAGSLREHNYQHRTITLLINAHTVRMRQFPAKDSFHALTIPPGIMAHKEAKTTSGFVIFLLLSEKEFRTLLFASSPFISSLPITALTSHSSRQLPTHLSIQPFIFYFYSHIFVPISLNPCFNPTFHLSSTLQAINLKQFYRSVVLFVVFFLHLSVCASIISLSFYLSLPVLILSFLFCPTIDPSFLQSIHLSVF